MTCEGAGGLLHSTRLPLGYARFSPSITLKACLALMLVTFLALPTAVDAQEDARATVAKLAGVPLVHDGKWVAARIVADRTWIEPIIKAAKLEMQD